MCPVASWFLDLGAKQLVQSNWCKATGAPKNLWIHLRIASKATGPKANCFCFGYIFHMLFMLLMESCFGCIESNSLSILPFTRSNWTYSCTQSNFNEKETAYMKVPEPLPIRMYPNYQAIWVRVMEGFFCYPMRFLGCPHKLLWWLCPVAPEIFIRADISIGSCFWWIHVALVHLYVLLLWVHSCCIYMSCCFEFIHMELLMSHMRSCFECTHYGRCFWCFP